MSDIVERLRALQTGGMLPVIAEAAAEIEQWHSRFETLQVVLTGEIGRVREILGDREAEIERLRSALQAMLDCHGKPHRADWISDAAYQHAVEVDAQARRALEPKP